MSEVGPEMGADQGHSARPVATIALVKVLTLGVVGNAILPLPSAFAATGALAGSLLLVCVALANAFTCKLLLRAAVATGAADYEHLALAVGGRMLKVWTEACIALLFFGTNLGGLAQLGQGAAYTVRTLWPDATGWASSGAAATLLLTLGIIFPLTMLPSLRQLEAAGTFGSIVVWVVALAVMAKSCAAGLPALRSGAWDTLGFRDLGDAGYGVSIFCFAFYLQVLLMPMLGEMPNEAGCQFRHRENAEVVGKAATITILGTAGLTYLLTGFFGAAMYGCDTASNLTENEWIAGAGGTFLLNALVTVYLSLSIPPIFLANMYTVNRWLSRLTRGGFELLPWWQQRLASLAAVGLPCLAAALALTEQSARVLSITGATGVAMVSWILPVICHFCLYLGWAQVQQEAEAGGPLDYKVDPEDPSHRAQSPARDLNGPGAAPGHLDDALPPLPGSSALLLSSHSMRHRGFEGRGSPTVASPAGGAEEGSEALEAAASRAKHQAQQAEQRLLQGAASRGLLYPALPYHQRWQHWAAELCMEVVLPAAILLLGLLFSIATLASGGGGGGPRQCVGGGSGAAAGAEAGEPSL